MKRATLAVAVLATLSLGAGWGVDAYSTTQGQVAKIETLQGRPFTHFAVYDGLDQGTAFPNTDAKEAMARGATIFLNITSTHIVELNPDTYVKLPYCWAGVASGRRDSLLQAWTAAIHATGYDKFIFTFAHEPTGTTNEHAPKCVSNTPAYYRAAFARVARFFRGHNVFAPFSFMAILRHFEDAGRVDPYVPWGSFSIIGGDTYDHAETWRTPAEMFGPFVTWRAHNCPDLPVLIGEFGIDSRHPDAPAMIQQSADYLEATWGTALIAVLWNLKAPWDIYTREAQDAFVEASRSTYYGGGG